MNAKNFIPDNFYKNNKFFFGLNEHAVDIRQPIDVYIFPMCRRNVGGGGISWFFHASVAAAAVSDLTERARSSSSYARAHGSSSSGSKQEA